MVVILLPPHRAVPRDESDEHWGFSTLTSPSVRTVGGEAKEARMNEKDKRELLDWLNDDDEDDETEEEDPLADDDEQDLEVRSPAPAEEGDRDELFSDEGGDDEPEIEQEPEIEAEPDDDAEARIEEEAPDEQEAEEEEEEDAEQEASGPPPEEEDEDDEEDIVVARATDEEEEETNELSPRPRRPSSSRWGPDLSGMSAMLAAGAGSAAAVARSGATHTASLGGAMKNMVFTSSKKAKSTPPKPADEAPSGLFSIGDDEEEFDERSGESDKAAKPPKPTMDPAALALAQHKIAGLRKGQQVVFDSANLPDTVLYSCIKLKSSKMGGISIGLTEKKLIRCIAVNRERILVFDTLDQPVKFGGSALVKSNHHLTELVKLTFPRSREKDVVAMHIRAGLPREDGSVATKANTYKVPRAQSFIKALQDRLARFR